MKRCVEMEEAGDNSRKVELLWHGLKLRNSDGWMRNIFRTQFSWHGIRVGSKFSNGAKCCECPICLCGVTGQKLLRLHADRLLGNERAFQFPTDDMYV